MTFMTIFGFWFLFFFALSVNGIHVEQLDEEIDEGDNVTVIEHQQWFIATDGNDEKNDGRTGVTPFASLAKALDAASAEDVITFIPGTYEGDTNCGLVVDKSLTIQGFGLTDAQQVHIKCADQHSSPGITISKNSEGEDPLVLMRGFTITMASATGLKILAGEVNLHSMAFVDNLGQQGGGIYISDDARMVGVNCKFERNQAIKGGAIYSQGHLSLKSGLFLIANFAKEDGGAIYQQGNHLDISNSRDLEKNWAGNQGGALFVKHADVVLELCHFHENQAEKSGGTVFSDDASTIQIKQSVFLRGHAGELGGALVIKGGAGVLSHCNFHLCTSADGGAVAAIGGAEILADSNEYSSNVGTGSGGAMFIESSEVKDTLDNSESFQFNTASHGGAIAIAGGTLLAQRANFANNTAVVAGGAIYGFQAKVVLRLSSLQFNSGVKGGGLFCNSSEMVLEHSHIGQNYDFNLECDDNCHFASRQSTPCSCEKCNGWGQVMVDFEEVPSKQKGEQILESSKHRQLRVQSFINSKSIVQQNQQKQKEEVVFY